MHSIALFIGKRNVGKTVCLKHIISMHTESVYQVPSEITEYTLSSFIEKQKQSTILVLDNCCHQINWTTSKNMDYIFHNNRQLQLGVLITLPYSVSIPPSMRACIDYVFIFKDTNVRDKRRLYEHYAGMFTSFEDFSHTMDQYTENYECLVIDNTTKSNKLEDQVFRFHW